MSIGDKLLNLALVASTASALAVMGMLGHRMLQRQQAIAAEHPTRVSTWPELTAAGHLTGGRTPQVTLVEFSDFECPFCAKLALTVLPALQAKYGEDLAVLHRHWPLPTHRHAYDAARAAECAGEQGAYERFALTLFEQQRSIGNKSYTQFAAESGVADTARFGTCTSRTDRVEAIERDMAAVAKLRTRGTPTLVLEGWIFDGLRVEQLDSAIAAEIAHKRRAQSTVGAQSAAR